MANVINRTTCEYLRSVNTLRVPEKYWKVVADTVVEMDQADKDIKDAALADVTKANTAEILKKEILPPSKNAYLTTSCTASGLVITTTVSELNIIDDETTIVADAEEIKYVLVCLVYNSTSDDFFVQVYEKTTGVYASLDADEYIILPCLNEFYVEAEGTDLVEV